MVLILTAPGDKQLAWLGGGRGEKGLDINGKLAGSIVKSN